MSIPYLLFISILTNYNALAIASRAQGDLDADNALNQLRTGQTQEAKTYFGQWLKVANNPVHAANGARYTGTLDYLADADMAAKWYKEALQLNPESEHSRVLQSLVNKFAASAEVSVIVSTGEKSPVVKDTTIEGDFVIGD